MTDEFQSASKKKKLFSILFDQQTENGDFSIFLQLQKGTSDDFVAVCHRADGLPEKSLQRCSQMMRLCLHNNEISDPGLIVRVLKVLTRGHY